MHEELLTLLLALDGVRQNLHHHPESDALFHSLQTFHAALRDTRDPTLLAAALLHDVGKSMAGPDHAIDGADLLDGLVAPRVVWLVRHHLDLLRTPQRTRRRLRNTPALARLERLRRYDLAGRDPAATVMLPEEAMDILMQSKDVLLPSDDALARDDEAITG
jgi:HD superfamily phosphodiesterase